MVFVYYINLCYCLYLDRYIVSFALLQKSIVKIYPIILKQILYILIYFCDDCQSNFLHGYIDYFILFYFIFDEKYGILINKKVRTKHHETLTIE